MKQTLFTIGGLILLPLRTLWVVLLVLEYILTCAIVPAVSLLASVAWSRIKRAA